MTRSQRWEGRVALAMLPIGATMLVVSAIGLVAVAVMAGDRLMTSGFTPLLILWCVFAAALALWNMRAGIAMMSAFDWRPLPFALLRSAGVVAGWMALP